VVETGHPSRVGRDNAARSSALGPGTNGYQPPTASGEPLADAVHRVLVDAIIRGILKPNERLTEERLAHVTGASRTPIREATRRLEAEGLLRRVPHRGVTVASLPGFTEEEFAAVLNVRRAVEGELGRLCALRISDAELSELQAIIHQAAAALLTPDPAPALVRLNTQFHDGINRASGSGWLLGVHASYRNLVLREHWVAAGRLASPRDSFAGHQEILDALRGHDAERTRTLIEQHISAAAWTREMFTLTRLASDSVDWTGRGGRG